MPGLADHDRVPLPDVDPGGIVLLYAVDQVCGLELINARPQGGKVERVDIIAVDVQRKCVVARLLGDCDLLAGHLLRRKPDILDAGRGPGVTLCKELLPAQLRRDAVVGRQAKQPLPARKCPCRRSDIELIRGVADCGPVRSSSACSVRRRSCICSISRTNAGSICGSLSIEGHLPQAGKLLGGQCERGRLAVERVGGDIHDPRHAKHQVAQLVIAQRGQVKRDLRAI